MKIFDAILEKFATNPSKHQLTGANVANDILFTLLTKIAN